MRTWPHMHFLCEKNKAQLQRQQCPLYMQITLLQITTRTLLQQRGSMPGPAQAPQRLYWSRLMWYCGGAFCLVALAEPDGIRIHT